MEENSNPRISVTQLIFIPSVITLGVTLLRLVGELQNWPAVLFSREPGGGGSIIGITWLALIFGVYFALKLARAGETPRSAGRVIGFALLGLLVTAGGGYLSQQSPALDFGLGHESADASVKIRWPDGTVTTHAVPAGLRTLVVKAPV